MKLIITLLFIASAFGRLEQGIYETQVSFNADEQFVYFHRSAFNGTNIEIKIHCKNSDGGKISVEFFLRSSPCGQEFFRTVGSSNVPQTNDSLTALKYYVHEKNYIFGDFDYKSFWYAHSGDHPIDCDDKDHLEFGTIIVPVKVDGTVISAESSSRRRKRDAPPEKKVEVKNEKKKENKNETAAAIPTKTEPAEKPNVLKTDHSVFKVDADEIYLLIIRFKNPEKKPTNVTVRVEWKNNAGYLGK